MGNTRDESQRLKGAYGWRGQNSGRVYSVCGSGEYQSMISGSGKNVASRQLKSDAVDGGEERTGVVKGDLPEGGGGLVFISFCCSATVRSKQGRSRGHWWEKSNS